jgi:hypothetical protein
VWFPFPVPSADTLLATKRGRRARCARPRFLRAARSVLRLAGRHGTSRRSSPNLLSGRTVRRSPRRGAAREAAPRVRLAWTRRHVTGPCPCPCIAQDKPALMWQAVVWLRYAFGGGRSFDGRDGTPPDHLVPGRRTHTPAAIHSRPSVGPSPPRLNAPVTTRLTHTSSIHQPHLRSVNASSVTCN